jgi:hypothetical protein
MTDIRKNKPKRPSRHPQQVSKDRFPTLDDLVLDRSLPHVHVKLFPARKKRGNKPTDQLVIELQCEV